MRQPSIAPQQSQRRVVVSFDTLAHDQRSSIISLRFLDSHVERMSNRQCSWRQRRTFGHKDVKNGSLSATQRGNTTRRTEVRKMSSGQSSVEVEIGRAHV